MKKIRIGRTRKDAQYRLNLSEEERRQQPGSPAGIVELGDRELHHATGAALATCPDCGWVACTCSPP